MFWKRKKQEEPVGMVMSAPKAVVKENFDYQIPAHYPEDVKEIHHEFYSASDRALQEVLDILKNNEINDQKIHRLRSLGFNQVPEVIEGYKKLQTFNDAEQRQNLLVYFREKYPMNKFINEDQVITICEKYNLVVGEVSRFRGFVPDKNLKDIENFKLRKGDEFVPSFTLFDVRTKRFYAAEEFAEIEWEARIGKGRFRRGTSWTHLNKTITEGGEGYWSVIDIFDMKGTRLENEGWSYKLMLGSSHPYFTSPLVICAPPDQMDMSGMEKVGHRIQKQVVLPKDPVVLKPVRGGFLIVTAWGPEASDPLVLNENHN